MIRPPVPLSQFVLKVHARCDLACDHCYIYESVDQSWHGRPVTISDQVIVRTAERIAEHAASHKLPSVQVILHGGEPLLAGRPRLRRVITELETALQGVSSLDLRIHTNGVLLSEEFCDLFAEHRVKIGISIDGGRMANDRHRRYADGRSSYDKVIRAIRLLRVGPFRDLYAGLLCTIDLANDPLAVYESLLEWGPPRIDFLLPHATWDNPPARASAAGSEYASWLIAIFDRWMADGCPTRIRTFDSILSTLRGGESHTEALGLEAASLVVIETDGSYEQADSLKAAFDGAPETGTNVFEHALDFVARHPGIRARQQGIAGLCDTCQKCPVVQSCGGGLYTHRYRTENGFANPSVYCADLIELISHISSSVPAGSAGGPGAPEHTLSGENFRALAAGAGGSAAVRQLIEAEHSLRRGLLGQAYQAGMAHPEVSGEVKNALRGAWALLTTLDREQPKALEAVLGHPYVRIWAVRGLEQAALTAAWRGPGNHTWTPWSLATHLGHLGAIAAAVAIRARMGAAVTVPVMDGAVHLPTLGRLVLTGDAAAGPPDGEPETARVSVITNAVIIRVGDALWTIGLAAMLAGEPSPVQVDGTSRSAEWQPVRVLRGRSYCIALEDTDPFRGCYESEVAPRLTDAEFARWQNGFQEAWQAIGREYRRFAAALGAGLTTVVPLAPAQEGRDSSASARNAFGAIAATLPADPGDLARLLVGEFQHVKLGGILDLCDLYDPADDRLFPAPEGEGKHRIEELLRGTYLSLAVHDSWREPRKIVPGPGADKGGPPPPQWRVRSLASIETLLGSGSLTLVGSSFVEEMRRCLTSVPGA